MAIFTEKGHGAPESEAALSIIGTGMRVVGDITADGVVKSGEVEGDVITREAIIGGEVRGTVVAGERAEIQASSVVHGDITSRRLLVHEGGEINGVIRMVEGITVEQPAGRDAD